MVAVKGIIINNNKILIVKRSDEDEVVAGTWETPGGKIEFGEKLEAALIREVKEEVGLDVSVGANIYSATFMSSPDRQVVIITYLCKTQQQQVTLSEEHSDFLWADKEELKSHLLPGILEDFDKNNVWDKLSE